MVTDLAILIRLLEVSLQLFSLINFSLSLFFFFYILFHGIRALASMASVNANSFATSSSTPTTTPTPTMANSITHINPSLLLLSNMSSMMTIKLDYSNYIVWRH